MCVCVCVCMCVCVVLYNLFYMSNDSCDSLLPRDVAVILVPILSTTSSGSQDYWCRSVSSSVDTSISTALLVTCRPHRSSLL